MTGYIYKVTDEQNTLKLPVTVSDAVYVNDRKLTNVLEDISSGSTVPFFRFRILSWNVGHWAKGNSGSSKVTPADYESTKMAFHKVFNDYNPDVVGCCEYSSIFYNNGSGTTTTARDDIFSQFKKYSIGSEIGYVGTAEFANCTMLEKNEISLENNYKALEFSLPLTATKKVKICMCHLPWQVESEQQASLDTLIQRYANEPYAIIMGDMNFHKNKEMTSINKLTAAGYQNANWGYMGKILTSYNNVVCSNYLDNIAVKGGSILRVQVLQNTPEGCDPDNPDINDELLWDAVNLSDHFPIIADVEFPLI